MSNDHERSADGVTEGVVWALFAGILLLSALAFIYPRDAVSGVATDGVDSASAEIGDADGDGDAATTEGDSGLRSDRESTPSHSPSPFLSRG